MDYKHDESNQISLEYARCLRQEVSRLFSGDFTVVTEMGRAVVATSGWFASRIEYTKIASGRLIGITHAGGNMFVREVYMGNTWYHPITIYDATGFKKTTDVQCVDLAGPLCFSGDLIAKGLVLPSFKQGDYVVYHHTAAYSIGMYSMYNSIATPPVYVYSVSKEANKVMVKLIKREESVQQLTTFWDFYLSCLKIQFHDTDELISTVSILLDN